MKTKDKTVETNFSNELLLGIIALSDIYKQHGQEIIITSGSELSTKHCKNSKHYIGDAMDIRSRNTPTYILKAIQNDVRTSLPNYDYLIESDHIHYQYNLK